MPIRFHCHRCNQLLSISSRKTGSEIECPKCGYSQVVPNQEAAAAAMAMNHFAKDHDDAESSSPVVVYDDPAAPIEDSQPAHVQAAAPKTPASPVASLPSPVGQYDRGRPVPSGMILYPRRTLYVQGLLLLILFVVGFGSGYLIGRGGAADGQPDEEAAKERILIQGNLVYDRDSGRPAGDRSAVIIALPQGKFPKSKIPFQGIRPQDSPDESNKSVRMIRQLGGEYARADASGDFSMVVPDRGKYHLLIVSSHAARPEGADPDEVDLIEMEPYFSTAKLLIGRCKYRWTLRQIDDHDTIDHDFGRNGQEREPR